MRVVLAAPRSGIFDAQMRGRRHGVWLHRYTAAVKPGTADYCKYVIERQHIVDDWRHGNLARRGACSALGLVPPYRQARVRGMEGAEQAARCDRRMPCSSTNSPPPRGARGFILRALLKHLGFV